MSGFPFEGFICADECWGLGHDPPSPAPQSVQMGRTGNGVTAGGGQHPRSIPPASRSIPPASRSIPAAVSCSLPLLVQWGMSHLQAACCHLPPSSPRPQGGDRGWVQGRRKKMVPGSSYHLCRALARGRRRCLAASAARFPNALQLGWPGPSPSSWGVVLGPRGSGS